MQARGTALLPVPRASELAALEGAYVRARNVRVQSVVGDEAFWVGGGGGNRLLVHLTGNGESGVAIRPGRRVSFIGTITPNRPGVAAVFGLVRSEGAPLLRRQGRHISVRPRSLRVDG